MDVDNAVRFFVYDSFVRSAKPPSVVSLANQLHLSIGEVHDSYQRLENNHVFVLQPDDPFIRMAMPFSAIQTDYGVYTGSTRYFGNCAWDAFGIVAALGIDAVVSCVCSDCKHVADFRIARGVLERNDGIVHYAVPASRWWDNIVYT